MTVRCAELHRLGRLSFTLPSPWQVSLGNGENRTFDRRCLGTRNALKILILLSHATKVGSAQAHTWNSCTSRHRQAHTYRHSFLQALTRTRADVSCIPASSRSVYEVHYVCNGRQDLRCDPEFRECLWLRASSGPLQPCDPDRSVIFSEAQDLLAADRRSRGNCSYGMTFICRSNDSPSSGHKRGARSWRHLTLG